jgi:Holliday junction resolvase RusA-like endonuclease
MTGGPITVMLDGAPVPKARARFGRGHAYTPATTRGFTHDLGWSARAAMAGRKPLTGAVTITALFELPIPSAWPKARHAAAITGDIRPAVKPDLDNFLKAVLDAINGIVIIDDSQIVEIAARKIYGAPKTVLTIFQLTESSP